MIQKNVSDNNDDEDTHGPCEIDWAKYKEETCLHVLKISLVKKLNYYNAKAYCMEHHEANLVSIGSQEKQLFLEEYLKSKKILGNVWIGLEHQVNTTYSWSDGTKFIYKNWAPGSPKNESGYCVQWETDNGEQFGNWSDVSCTEKKVVLCEKIQLWSLLRLQETIMNMLSTQMVPIGFIFLQLPYEKPPTEIWPSLTWENVNADYNGVFFRVLGNKSNSFNDIQYENSPRLQTIYSNAFGSKDDPRFTKGSAEIKIGEKSKDIICGTIALGDGNVWQSANSEQRTIKFRHSDGEVRPKNVAINVWKRV